MLYHLSLNAHYTSNENQQNTNKSLERQLTRQTLYASIIHIKKI